MADSSDLSVLPPQIFALLVETTSVWPLWVQLKNIQLLSVAVSKSGKKNVHLRILLTTSSFCCVCRRTLPPTVLECAHEEGSADMSAKQQQERDGQKD